MKKELNETAIETTNRSFLDYLGELPNPIVYLTSLVTICMLILIILMVF